MNTRTSLARLAWRNVFRNRRRSALNIIALTVGMAILVLALGWIGGYHRYIYDTLNDFQTGELQIVSAEWYADRARLPVDTLIGNSDELRSAVLSLPAVRSAAPRVVFSARVSTGREGFRLIATAIDPTLEGDVGVLDEYIVEGVGPTGLATNGGADTQLGADSGRDTARGLWIGRPVAEKAGIEIGDNLFLRAMNRHGVENLYDAPVVGIFEYGYPLLDQQMLYLDLITATELLDLDGGVTHLVIRLREGEDVRDAVEEIAGATVRLIAGATPPRGGEATTEIDPAPVFAFERYGPCAGRELPTEDRIIRAGMPFTNPETATAPGAPRVPITPIPGSRGGLSVALPGAGGTDAVAQVLQVRPWQDFARAAVSAVEGDTYGFTVMVIVMYLLIVLGILNSMSMSVHERTREIGTIRAIGIRRGQLLSLFALESVWQSLIAAAVALVITTPVALWLVNTGVDIASSMPDTIPVPFGERFRADFAPWHYILTLASGVLTALAGAILPARRAGKITVAEAMRTVG